MWPVRRMWTQAMEVARSSITVVRNEGEVLPLAAEDPLRVLHLVISGNLASHRQPKAELEGRRIDSQTYQLGPEVSSETAEEIVALAPEFTHVLVSAFVRVSAGAGPAEMSPSQERLLQRLGAAGRPMIVVSFGSPYMLARVPSASAYVCTYGAASVSQQAAMEVLFGEVTARGRLPVSLPGLYDEGHGLELPQRAMTLSTASPEEAGFSPAGLREVDRLLDSYRQRRAFPGGVVAIGHRGALAHLHPFGTLTYEADAPAVTTDTLYDLASLTKVIATTTMAMMLVDEERFELDSPVEDFLPLFQGAGKSAVTVRHLLTHSSGIDWWAPLYEELTGSQAYVEHIQAMDLVYEPGSRTMYSDLGVILLGEILERVAGEPIDRFMRRRVFEPLGMESTQFRPRPELLGRIAPTEHDPRRGKIVHGQVHDENAAAMGGVAPHAGLFGTAGDLARFAQMLLNGGVFEHHRLISRSTLRSIHPQGGWDARLQPGFGLGHPVAERFLGWCAFFRSLLRPHGLHRHFDVGRSAARAVRHLAHQPGTSFAREPSYSGGPAGLGRCGGEGPAEPMNRRPRWTAQHGLRFWAGLALIFCGCWRTPETTEVRLGFLVDRATGGVDSTLAAADLAVTLVNACRWARCGRSPAPCPADLGRYRGHA